MKLSEPSVMWPLSHSTIVWFKASNTYVLAHHQTAELIHQINKGLSTQALQLWCISQLELTSEQATELITSINDLMHHLSYPKISEINEEVLTLAPNHYEVVHQYQLGTKIIQASFQTEALEFLIHPKLAHLKQDISAAFHHHFEVYQHQQQIFLKVDGQYIGQWPDSEVHYFQGKFSMKMVEQLYELEESEWMGVFHATAMSNGQSSLLFAGDSGNGKSTLAALLLAKGYQLWADDFVPIRANPPLVYHFPAAISIKEKAVPVLKSLFPDLEKAPLFHLKELNKHVRYLPAPELGKGTSPSLPCKAIVFIKYKASATHQLEKMTQEEAFERLIPDSWLSPEPDNAHQFMQWFAQMPCYQLNYSDTELMYQSVQKLFNL